ncbi:MAG: hypothetical protein V1773_00415 [bacterium]
MRIINYINKPNIFFSLLFFIFLNSINYSQTAKYLNEKIIFEESGDATVIIDFSLENKLVKTLLLPYNIKSFPVKIISHNKNINYKIVTIEGNNFIKVFTTDSLRFNKGSVTLNIKDFYNLKKEKITDFGNYTFKYRFNNSKIAKINDYKLEILLPVNFNITSVEESVPKQSEDSPKSPFEISRESNRNKVVLTSKDIKLGENAFIRFRFKSEKKSSLVFILFALAGVLYLVFFTDVLKDNKGKNISQ